MQAVLHQAVDTERCHSRVRRHHSSTLRQQLTAGPVHASWLSDQIHPPHKLPSSSQATTCRPFTEEASGSRIIQQNSVKTLPYLVILVLIILVVVILVVLFVILVVILIPKLLLLDGLAGVPGHRVRDQLLPDRLPAVRAGMA